MKKAKFIKSINKQDNNIKLLEIIRKKKFMIMH
jgi:hypothetical protein